MEHQEQTPTTRDIAGAGARTEPPQDDESRFSRDDAPADMEATQPDRELSSATETETAGAAGNGAAAEPPALLAEQDQSGFQGRWEDIQTRFVDDPRRAVEDADALVATVMQRLADGFADERGRLEGMWGRGEDVGTEDLRIALQRYRSFFQRLLSA
jgi:hypothetical protein